MLPKSAIINPRTAELYLAVDKVTRRTVADRRKFAIRENLPTYSLSPNVKGLDNNDEVKRGLTAAGMFYLSLPPLEGESELVASQRAEACRVNSKAANFRGSAVPDRPDLDYLATERAIFLARSMVFIDILERWVTGRENTQYRARVSPRELARHTNSVFRALSPWSAFSPKPSDFYSCSLPFRVFPADRMLRSNGPGPVDGTYAAARAAAYAAAASDPDGWGTGPPPTPRTDLCAALHQRSAIEAMVRP